MHPSVARTANVSGKKIGTRLTLERSRDVIRECSRTTFISPPLLLQHVVTASGSNAYVINLSVPCRKSMCFGNVPLQNRAWNTPIFIIDTFPYKIVEKKKKKKELVFDKLYARNRTFSLRIRTILQLYTFRISKFASRSLQFRTFLRLINSIEDYSKLLL